MLSFPVFAKLELRSDRKSTRLNSSHLRISYAVFCLHSKNNRQCWVLPGGRLEYREAFFECAAREIREETGLDVEVERFVFMDEAIAQIYPHHIVDAFIN